MNKFIVAHIALILLAFSLNAQNKNVDIAHSEFRKGNYEDAVGLYNGAIATTADLKEKERLIAEREKSSKCWEYLDEAERYYSQSNYKAALRFYSYIASLNSIDAYTQKQIKICRKRIEQEEFLAKENARINNLLANLLKSNDITQLKKFATEYPQHKQTYDLKEILRYYDNPRIIENQKTVNKRETYIKYGNFYFKYNKEVAASFYEKSAICGSLTGFYNLAISLPSSDSNRIKRLLAFAAANGDNEADKLLNSKYPRTTYNKEKARRLYSRLNTANEGDLFSKIYCQKHKDILALYNLALIDDKTNYMSNDGNLLYELGMMYLDGKYVKKNLDKSSVYLQNAASMGDHRAQYKLANMSSNYEYKNALMLCAAINGNELARVKCQNGLENAKEYVKFLKQEYCNLFNVWLFLEYNAKNYSIEDADTKLISLTCYKHLDRKKSKAAIKLLKSRKSWDVATIQKIKNIILNTYGSKRNKFHKKIIKSLRKVSTAENIRQEGFFQTLVHNGYCTKPYKTIEITIEDYLK